MYMFLAYSPAFSPPKAVPKSPPALKYEFKAALNSSGFMIDSLGVKRTLPGGLVNIAVSEKSEKFAQLMDATPPFNKAQEQIACVGSGASVWSLNSFFDEEICYEMPLGAPPGTTAAECMEHEVSQVMPIDGHFGAPAGAYTQSKYDGETTDGSGRKLTKWLSITPWQTMGRLKLNVTSNGTSKIAMYTLYGQVNVSFRVADDGHLALLNASSHSSTVCANSTAECKAIANWSFHMVTGNSSAVTLHEYSKVVAPAPASSFAPPAGTACVKLDNTSSSSASVPSVPSSLPRWGGVDGWWVLPAALSRVNDQDAIDAINAETPRLPWTAGATEYMPGATLAELPLMDLAFMSQPRTLALAPHADALRADYADIPAAFDARTQWPHCPSIGTIRNQGSCGSCWAFGAVETLQDRMCIAAGAGKPSTPTLSAESLVDCDKTDGGCRGGFLDNAWKHLAAVGAMSDACDPYQHCADPAYPNCSTPAATWRAATAATAEGPPPMPNQCPTVCAADGKKPTYYKAASAYAVAKPGDVEAMQREVMAHGPIEVAFFVFSDFQQYVSGVYRRSATARGPLGGHAVKIVGWGDEGGVPYWLVANSWSPHWGEKGFFKILRGANECGIETTPAAGLAAAA